MSLSRQQLCHEHTHRQPLGTSAIVGKLCELLIVMAASQSGTKFLGTLRDMPDGYATSIERMVYIVRHQQ